MVLVGFISMTVGIILLRTAFADEPDPRIVLANMFGFGPERIIGEGGKFTGSKETSPEVIGSGGGGGGGGAW